MLSIEKAIVSEDSTLKDSMSVIEKSKLKVALIMKKN